MDPEQHPRWSDAFLMAASHFLNSWPIEWDSERLAMALLADEDSPPHCLEDQKLVFVWNAIEDWAEREADGREVVYDLIHGLACDFIKFLR